MESLVNRLPQWIDLEKARAALKSGTGKAIRIAIIDSGVETSHPELGDLQLADDVQIYSDGVKVAMREGNGSDLYGHGTAVAGVLTQIAREAEIGSFPNDDGPSVNCDCPQLFGRRRAKNRPFASRSKIPGDELAGPIAIQVTNSGHLRRSLGQQIRASASAGA